MPKGAPKVDCQETKRPVLEVREHHESMGVSPVCNAVSSGDILSGMIRPAILYAGDR